MSNRFQTQAAVAESLLKETLDAVFTCGQPADQFLKQYFRSHHGMGGRDRRLYSNLIFAVLRWYGPLKRAFANREPSWYLAGAMAAEKMEDPVREFYPAAEISGDSPLERLNCFFRTHDIPEAHKEELYPDWFFRHLDFEPSERFYQLEQTRSPLWLRVQRGQVDFPEAQPHPVLPSALMIRDPHINLPETEAYKKRLIEIQDLSSQCIGLTCVPAAGERWWDACAGGGGKSLQLASLMNGKGRITASDIREEKLNELKRRASESGFYNIRTQVWDGHTLPEGLEYAMDGVLVDAPCTSSGRWRRNPEGRWLITEERIAELSKLQQTILAAASQAVRPGGVLVYATCSLFRDENRLNAELFLNTHPDFKLEPFAHPLSGKMTSGMLQVLPEDGDCDCAFMARFRRKE